MYRYILIIILCDEIGSVRDLNVQVLILFGTYAESRRKYIFFFFLRSFINEK